MFLLHIYCFWQLTFLRNRQCKKGIGAFVCGLGLTNQHSLIFFHYTVGNRCSWHQLLYKLQLATKCTDSIPKRTNEGKNNKNTDIANDTQITEVDTFVEREKQRAYKLLIEIVFLAKYMLCFSIYCPFNGLVPYIYMPMPLESRTHGDATTIFRFLKHLLRRVWNIFASSRYGRYGKHARAYKIVSRKYFASKCHQFFFNTSLN